MDELRHPYEPEEWFQDVADLRAWRIKNLVNEAAVTLPHGYDDKMARVLATCMNRVHADMYDMVNEIVIGMTQAFQLKGSNRTPKGTGKKKKR